MSNKCGDGSFSVQGGEKGKRPENMEMEREKRGENPINHEGRRFLGTGRISGVIPARDILGEQSDLYHRQWMLSMHSWRGAIWVSC